MQKILLLTHREIDKSILASLKSHEDIDLFNSETLYDDIAEFEKILDLPHKNKTVNSIYIDTIFETHQITRHYLTDTVKYITLIGNNVSPYRLPGLVESFCRTWKNNIMLWESYDHNQLENFLGIKVKELVLPSGNDNPTYQYYLNKVKFFLNSIR